MSIFTKRKNYRPFEYGEITNPLIYAMWDSHWTHREFNFDSDVQDFKTKLTHEEQGLVKRALLMVSQVEVSIKSYWSNIGKLLPKPEIADMGAVFGGVEVIHSRAYSEILNKLGFDEEFQKVFLNNDYRQAVEVLEEAYEAFDKTIKRNEFPETEDEINKDEYAKAVLDRDKNFFKRWLRKSKLK